MCQAYLKNAIISIVYLAERNQMEHLKTRILGEVQRILEVNERDAGPEADTVDAGAETENGESIQHEV